LRRQIRELEQKLTDDEYEEFLREEGAAQYFPAARAYTMSNAKLQRKTGGNYKLKRNSKTKRRNGKTKRRYGKTKRRNGKTKRTRRTR
jgi:hypothetical protein